MRLDELTEHLDIIQSSSDLIEEITSVEYDSRRVKRGTLFVAVRGYTTDGNNYIGEAEKRGAVAIVTDEPEATSGVTLIVVHDARKALAVLSDRVFGSPQNSLVMTAITGTNGKTTTSYMVQSIFRAGGMDCGLIGTIAHEAGGKAIPSANTTPEARDIHGMLADMVSAGQHACVMEVSSHALALSRVYGIKYRAVAMTNITRDHLDFHGTFEEYLDAKSILFSSLHGDSTAVVNLDDPHVEHIISVSRSGKLLTYGFKNTCDIHPISYELGAKGTKMVLSTPSGEISCWLPIPGMFNISNAMAATGIGITCGFSPAVIADGLENMTQVKGRFELVEEGQSFNVVIDYAHTPDALQRIISSVREITKGRVIVVFGCGGDRDRGKRSQMGEISGRLADYTIVTSDNPRSEDPEQIITEIKGGIPEVAQFKTFIDREEGIMAALKYAGPDDTVIIAGKGHEDYQIVGSEKVHFDDAESVRRLIKAMEWKASHCNGC